MPLAQDVGADDEGHEAGDAALLGREEVIRFDHAKRTYALYQTADGRYHATDGTCTHGNTHLADGLVKGNTIECPKHNGRFDVSDGSPLRPPVCVALRTYPLENRAGRLFLNIAGAAARQQVTRSFRVVSNHNLATFIKELLLEPVDERHAVTHRSIAPRRIGISTNRKLSSAMPNVSASRRASRGIPSSGMSSIGRVTMNTGQCHR